MTSEITYRKIRKRIYFPGGHISVARSDKGHRKVELILKIHSYRAFKVDLPGHKAEWLRDAIDRELKGYDRNKR